MYIYICIYTLLHRGGKHPHICWLTIAFIIRWEKPQIQTGRWTVPSPHSHRLKPSFNFTYGKWRMGN